MKTLLTFIILFPVIMFGQKFNKKVIDPRNGNEILVGRCTREGFSTINSNFDSIYKAEYTHYVTDKETIANLKEAIKDVKIVLVLGTWCGDSKEWVPRFMKVMDEIDYPMKKLKMISVDRSKKAGKPDISKLGIERVPTFIFFRNKKEIGRIIEVPADIIEKDILRIILATN